MFDTMTMTKLAGGLFGALLVFLLGGWVSQSIYSAEKSHGDEDGHGQAYVIDTGAEESSGEESAEVDFATLMAAADPAKGEKVFGKCKACHKLEKGANSTGPYLYGVVGRAVGASEGFGYSGALQAVAEVWTPEALDGFLENPRSYAPGTSMAFAGLNKPEERADVIAYLDMTDGELTPVAGGTEEAATEEVTEEAATEEATEEAATEEAATEEATEEAATEEATEETAAEEAAAEEATEETATEEAAAEEATEEAAMEEAAAEETTEEAATEEAAAEEATEEAATEETTEEATAEETDTADASADTASGFAALVAAADVAEGEKAFNKCKACHVVEAGKNRTGPYLHGVVGRDIASAEGFNFSDALSGLEGVWDYDHLNAFLENPRGYAPGNKMGFAGLKKEEERAAVIAYIESVSQ